MAPATATPFPVPAPGSDAIETEVLNSYDARQKLSQAITDQESKRKQAELDLAKNYGKEIRNTPVDVEKAFQANKTWQDEDNRTGERIAALTNIRSKVDLLLTKHTTEDPEAVKAALNKRLQKITRELEQQTDAATDLEQEKKKIEDEIAKLTKAYTTTAAPATKAAAKRAKKR